MEDPEFCTSNRTVKYIPPFGLFYTFTQFQENRPMKLCVSSTSVKRSSAVINFIRLVRGFFNGARYGSRLCRHNRWNPLRKLKFPTTADSTSTTSIPATSWNNVSRVKGCTRDALSPVPATRFLDSLSRYQFQFLSERNFVRAAFEDANASSTGEKFESGIFQNNVELSSRAELRSSLPF